LTRCGGGQESNLASRIFADTLLTLHHAPTNSMGRQESNLHIRFCKAVPNLATHPDRLLPTGLL